MPSPLGAEKGRSASFDITRSAGPLSTTMTLFMSRVTDAVKVDRDEAYVIRNADRTTNTGVELLATLRHEPYALTGTYTFVRSRERDRGTEVDSPLTPRHSAGLVGMWEKEDVGRIGVEVYYTGRQRLEVNPYADDERAICDCRTAGRTSVRAAAPVHQRRESLGREANEVASAASAVARRRRTDDRGRLGAARRPQHQRWREDSVLVMQRHC